MKIGVPKDCFFEDIDEEIEKSVHSVINELCSLGAERIDVNIPLARYSRVIGLAM